MEIITLIVGVVFISNVNGQQPEIRPPHNAGTIGREAYIDCYTFPREYTFEWREFATSDSPGGNLIYSSETGLEDNRFDVQEGIGFYRLIILNVQPELAGIYQCGFVEDNARANATFLAVSELRCSPSKDVVVKGNPVVFTAQTFFYGHLSSETFVVSPAWFYPNDGLITGTILTFTNEYIQYNTSEIVADDVTNGQNFRSVLRLLAQPDGETEALNEECYASYALAFPPQNIAIDREIDNDGRVEVREGDEITCMADAQPEATFEWFVHADGRTIGGNVLTATAEMLEENTEATCTASNEHGEESLTIQLNRYASGSSNLLFISYPLLLIHFFKYFL